MNRFTNIGINKGYAASKMIIFVLSFFVYSSRLYMCAFCFLFLCVSCCSSAAIWGGCLYPFRSWTLVLCLIIFCFFSSSSIVNDDFNLKAVLHCFHSLVSYESVAKLKSEVAKFKELRWESTLFVFQLCCAVAIVKSQL